MVGSREDAADLAQEAYLKAWQALPSFQGESSFSTWLHRLTVNLCIDFIRKERRRRDAFSVVSLDDEESGRPEPAAPAGEDPQRRLEQAELRRALKNGLAALPDRQRQILIMREMGGLSYQEISEELSLDLGTVKSRIARARLALREILREDGNFFPGGPSKGDKRKGGGPA